MEFLRKLNDFNIILASQSPRRKELLEQAGVPFIVKHKAIAEHFPENTPPHEVVMLLSQEKSVVFSDDLKLPGTIIITADTIVVVDGKIINKPANYNEAVNMLSAISGKCHQVYTGVCIRYKEQQKLFFEMTKVCFRELSFDEIEYYVKKYQPLDKAGAYGIQEWIGHVGISRINGSYSNVVGLPVERLYAELKNLIG